MNLFSETQGEGSSINGRQKAHAPARAAATKRRPAKGMQGNGNSRRSGRGYHIDPGLRLRFGLSNAPIAAPAAPGLPNSPRGRLVGHRPRLNLAKQVSFCAHQGTATLRRLLTCRTSKVKCDSLCTLFLCFVLFFSFCGGFSFLDSDRFGQTGNGEAARVQSKIPAVPRCQRRAEKEDLGWSWMTR
jgi:hypothetical protein